MNNQVAAPCCGSCEHCKTCIHGVRCYERTPYLIIALGNSCLEGRKYKPVNPIPIIELPGVKEMVEAAFGEGLHYGFEWDLDYPAPPKFQKMVSKYMKALEAKDE